MALTDFHILLVCGGREYSDRQKVFNTLDDYRDLTPNRALMILQGGARGADALAHAWACKRSVPSLTLTADWDRFGTNAGPRRNQEMLNLFYPQCVIAFPGGYGTQDMISRARANGIPVDKIK